MNILCRLGWHRWKARYRLDPFYSHWMIGAYWTHSRSTGESCRFIRKPDHCTRCGKVRR